MTTLTRDELYALVWSEPIQKLAKRYGLSDRGLGKLCARYNIPVPPRGWWAKKAAGKRVSRPKLPTLDDPYRQKIRVGGSPKPTEDDARPLEVHPLVLFEQQKENAISVREQLELTHALVIKTQKRLANAKRDANGLITAPSAILHVHTSRAQHERALRILQTLLTAFESRRFPVKTAADTVQVTILDEALGFGIEEGTKNVEHRISFTEQKQIDRGMGWQVPKWDHEPSGYLALVITNVHGLRQRWSEGPQKPLEGMLNKFVIGLIRGALGVKRQREEAERRECQRLEDERKRQEEARRLAVAELRWREEQARIERLERLGAMWTRNERFRQLVAGVRTALGEVDGASEVGKWLSWAETYADRSDPLNRFRNRKSDLITLFYFGYDYHRIAEDGFREPSAAVYGNEKPKSGVELTDRPPRLTAYERALKVELPEDMVLAYEWPQESDHYWRMFRVPAETLNRFLGFGGRGAQIQSSGAEDEG
jgi:hypothetical protein